MSAKAQLFGVVIAYNPDSIGLNGLPLKTYLVATSFGGEQWEGFSVKGDQLIIGDEVDIIDCGSGLDPWSGWGLVKRSYGYPTVYNVKHFATQRHIASHIGYQATSAMNWLCRAAGCIGRLYWAGKVAAVWTTTIEVQDPYLLTSRVVPVSSDLLASSFSVGDTVLVYSPSSGEECIGWWLMEPGIAIGTIKLVKSTHAFSHITPGIFGVDPNSIYITYTANKLYANGSAAFWYKRPEYSWTPGAYLLGLFVNGESEYVWATFLTSESSSLTYFLSGWHPSLHTIDDTDMVPLNTLFGVFERF